MDLSSMRCPLRKQVTEPYDPLDYANLARSIVQALLSNDAQPLPPATAFNGAGVYAIYYRGDFAAYRPIVTATPPPPIYVGKAVPTGARKGIGLPTASQGRELFRRLAEHAKNIEQAENIELGDFRCRYLVVVPVWITLAERFLVEYHKPIWNVLIEGFGNHDPGAGRRGMKRPRWDIVHPGRPWASELEPAETAHDVLERFRE